MVHGPATGLKSTLGREIGGRTPALFPGLGLVTSSFNDVLVF